MKPQNKSLGKYTVNSECYYEKTSHSMNLIAAKNKGEVMLKGLNDSIGIKASTKLLPIHF